MSVRINCDKHNIVICIKRDTYETWKNLNPVIRDGELILVTELPWHKSMFGFKTQRLKVGDGKTTFNNLRFII